MAGSPWPRVGWAAGTRLHTPVPGGGGMGGCAVAPRSQPPGSRLAGQRGLRATGVMP